MGSIKCIGIYKIINYQFPFINNFQQSKHNFMFSHQSSLFTHNQCQVDKDSSLVREPYKFTQNESDNIITQDDSHCKGQGNSLHKLSNTDREIQSHQIIRELLKKSQQNVVKHEINIVSPQLQFYKIKRPKSHSVYHYTSENMDKSIKKDERIKTIYKEMRQNTPAWRRIEISEESRKNTKVSKSLRQNEQKSKRSNNISLSGLTTYNFHSVKARYRIAYDPQGTQQQVVNTVKRSKQRSNCSISRGQKIHFKTSPNEAEANQSMSQVITHNFKGMSTQSYLKYLEIQKKNSSSVYGQKFGNLSSTSKIMNLDQIDQETAQFAINQIKLSIIRPNLKIIVNSNKKGRCKVTKGIGFQNRRLPIQHTKIIVNNLQIE